MRRKKTNYLFIMLVSIAFFSIAYAALTQSFRFNGTTKVEKTTWDVHLDNIRVIEKSIEPLIAPTIESDGATVNFSVNLKQPGECYEFDIDIVNNGTVDAMIGGFDGNYNEFSQYAKYLDFKLTYQNGAEIKAKDLVKKNSTLKLKVKVEFKKDVTVEKLPSEEFNSDFNFNMYFIQSDGTGKEVTNNGAWEFKADGSIDDIGTIVTIGTEKFYTIGTEGDNVKLLSMYNLYVGGEKESEDSLWKYYGVEATGMQDERMTGTQEGSAYPKNGLVPFSTDECHGTYSTSYQGSVVEGYVNEYKTLLESYFDIEVVSARLIYKSELNDTNTFNCVDNGQCSATYPWIYSTAYWVDTLNITDYYNAWDIERGSMHLRKSAAEIYYSLGVRPVIIIPKAIIK